MSKLIKNVVNKELCTGCGTCVGSCPSSAINMYKDKKYYTIKLNQDLCTQCDICLKACPGYSVDYNKLNLSIFGNLPTDVLIGNYFNCYIGCSTDKNIRYNSASGGLITQLLVFALENHIIDGALVTKMSKENSLEPEVFIASTKEDIILASGSKYCPVPLNKAIKEILEFNGKIAVVGLPCHINGLRKIEEINKKLKEKIWLHLGIFCSRNNNFMATEFWLNWFDIKSSEVEKINYRGKGWPGHMNIKMKGDNNEKLIPLNKYMTAHEFRIFTPKYCSLCQDLTCELSDISFGDPWLPEIEKNEEIGMSICVSRNKFSDEFLKDAISKEAIKLNSEDINIVKLSQGVNFKKNYSKAAANIYNFFDKNACGIPFENDIVPKKIHYLAFLLYNFQSYFLSKKIFWPCTKVLLPIEDYFVNKLKLKNNK